MFISYIAMCLILGTTFFAIRVGVEAGMPPFLFAALRFSIAGILLIGFIYFRNKHLFPLERQVYVSLANIGLYSTTVVFSIVFFVEQYIPSFYVALLTSTMPIMILLIDRIKGNLSITILKSIGLGLGLAGVLIVAWPGIKEGVPNWLPNTIALLIAQIAGALGAIKSRPILDKGISPLVVSGFQALFGSVGLFILSIFTEGLSLSNVQDWVSGILALAYLSIFGSIIALTLYYWIVKKGGAVFASTWTYISPVIAIVAGYIWFNEPVSFFTILGTLITLTGLFILNYKEFQQIYIKLIGTEGKL